MHRLHSLRIKKQYYYELLNGTKKLEIRVGYSQIKKIKAGDSVVFSDYSNQQFDVVRVTRYNDFCDLLDTEDSQEIIPGVSKYKALEILQGIYPEDKESLGVYVLELRKAVSIKILKASDYIEKNHRIFSEIIEKGYNVTDHICKDYPNHFRWYWTKEVPRVLNGTGDIYIATIDNKIAGVIFLKKDDENESKICTIFVSESCRGMRVATALLNEAFKFLGTNKPLISIADYKLEQFSGIIKKYNWKETQILGEGFYNNTSREHVFNGHIFKLK